MKNLNFELRTLSMGESQGTDGELKGSFEALKPEPETQTAFPDNTSFSEITVIRPQGAATSQAYYERERERERASKLSPPCRP